VGSDHGHGVLTVGISHQSPPTAPSAIFPLGLCERIATSGGAGCLAGTRTLPRCFKGS
jgi:hypothetical protein